MKTILAVRSLLLNDPTLAALHGGRVWAERTVPPVGYVLGDGAAIAVAHRGGMVEYVGVVERHSLQVKCYGRSEVEAAELDLAVRSLLQDYIGGGLAHAACEVIGQPLREPETGWPFYLSFYTVVTRRF